MRVAFDYLRGPALGHKTRCEILQRELVARGHTIVGLAEAKDWRVYDYPTPPMAALEPCKRLLMGQLPITAQDYAWHPLGAVAERTMHGPRYIIVDPYNIMTCFAVPKISNILITCGGSDPFGLTERLLSALGHYADNFHQDPRWGISANIGVVIGPNFGREVSVPFGITIYRAPNNTSMCYIMAQYNTVVAAWGGTVFEALALGCHVLPITTQPEHPAEAEILGIPYITRQHDFTDETLLFRKTGGNFGIDYQGVTRVVEQMEAWHGS